MRVLFLTHNFPRHEGDRPGSFLLRLALALRDVGVTVAVVAPSAPGVASRADVAGIAVERVRYGPRRAETLAYGGDMVARVRGSPTGPALLAALLGATAVRARAAARRGRFDVVHAHWWFPSGLSAAIARALGAPPLVTTLHGSDVRIARDVAPMRPLFRAVAGASTRLTAVSSWLAREAERLVPGRRLLVAPMPVDAERFGARHDAPPPPDRLLFVGKLDEQKGSAHLLRALARMRRTATLDLVVAPGADEGPVRRLADALGVAGRLRWHGVLPPDRLAALYRETTALVVPSIDEGLGLVALEAQLASRPVVAFDSGGLADIVDDRVTGRLVRAGDHDALAVALDELLDRPDRGGALGAAGRARVLERFAPAAVAARYADVYRAAARGERE